MGNQLEFRPTEPHDCEQLSSLFSQLWTWHLPSTYWYHKLFTNPAGPPIAHVAVQKESQEIVGSLSCVPLRYRLRGQNVTGLVAQDMGVLPEHRRSGTILHLHKLAEEEAARSMPAFAQGTPSSMAEIVGTRILKGTRLCPLPVFSRRVSVRGMLPKRLRPRLNSSDKANRLSAWKGMNCLQRAYNMCRRDDIEIEFLTEFDDRFDELWNRVQDVWPLALIRDSAFLNWRFVEDPVREYEIWVAMQGEKLLGYCATLNQEREGLSRGRVVDFLCDPDYPGAAEALLLQSAGMLLTSGIDVLVGWFLPSETWSNLLGRVGLRYHPEETRHIVVRSLFDENCNGLLTDPRQWYYTGADSDQL